MSNGIYLFYIIALIPTIIGTVLFMFNRRVNWAEWLGGTAVAFLTSAFMHGIAIYNMTADIETWSGRITHACHFPQWVEEYEEMHTREVEDGVDEDGNTTYHTEIYYTTEHATHREHWVAYLNFGTINDEKEISLDKFNEIKANFGGVIVDGGKQSTSHGGHYDGGDNNIYLAPNNTGYIYPSTIIRHFENKVKAAPTVFSFIKVPTNCPVYEWPENPNWMVSDRLLGVSTISPLEFDRMNSRLGPNKLVNVIMVGFHSPDSMLGQYQEAKWIGGKKNDLVLCYGFDGSNVLWSYCFGWTEQEICKRNLETILLQHPINNDILPLIENEIKSTYIKKDWHKFDYITIEPPTWAYVTLLIVMVVTQVIFWVWANFNGVDKD